MMGIKTPVSNLYFTKACNEKLRDEDVMLGYMYHERICIITLTLKWQWLNDFIIKGADLCVK